MTEELKVFLIFLIGILASYFGNFTSGGIWSIAIGSMSLLWIGPQMAWAVFKIGKFWNALSGVFVHRSAWTIPKDLVFWSWVCLMFWAFLVSYLIFSVPEKLIYGVSGITMLLVTAISLYKKPREHREHISEMRKRFGYWLYFLLSIIGNIFLAGSGVWYYFVNQYVFRLTAIESRGLSFATNPFWTVWSFLGLYVAWWLNLLYWGALLLWMMIGGYFSAKHLLKFWNAILEKIILITVLLLAFRFLYLAFFS